MIVISLKKNALNNFKEAYKKYLDADHGIINAEFKSAFANMVAWRDVASEQGASDDELSYAAEEVWAKHLRETV